MNKRQVTILWVIAIALGVAVAAVKFSQNTTTRSTTNRVSRQTLFESFPAKEVSTIVIQGVEGSVTIAKKDTKWTVAERGAYPANKTYVNDFIRTLGDLKVTQGVEAGPSSAPHFGMNESATKSSEHGLTATFKDAGGKELAKISLGKNIAGSATPSPMGGGGAVGRYIRNHADTSGFYAVSELFPSVSDDAKRWLSDEFINPEKIKSITLSQLGKTDAAWKLIRDGEEAEFKLEGATATEVLDIKVSGPLKTLFSYARFEDVVTAEKVSVRIKAEGKRTATIETFEGFIYTLTITPTKSSGPAPAAFPGAVPPAADTSYLLTVDVAAELPKERKKEDSEKPEDAKTKDTAFTERMKTLTEKLTKEKAFAGITFEVRSTLVEALLKERADLIIHATPPSDDDAETGGVQSLPGGMIARPPSGGPPPRSLERVKEGEK